MGHLRRAKSELEGRFTRCGEAGKSEGNDFLTREIGRKGRSPRLETGYIELSSQRGKEGGGFVLKSRGRIARARYLRLKGLFKKSKRKKRRRAKGYVGYRPWGRRIGRILAQGGKTKLPVSSSPHEMAGVGRGAQASAVTREKEAEAIFCWHPSMSEGKERLQGEVSERTRR